MAQTDSNRNLLTIHHRRLAKLKEQAAMFGASTPPHILLEIEDIEAQIRALESESPATPEKSAPKSGGTTITVIGDGNVIATDGSIAVGGDVEGDVKKDGDDK